MMSARPDISCEQIMPTVCVPDVTEAANYYRDQLGFTIDFFWGEPPAHAGVNFGGSSVHFSTSDASPAGFWLYFVVEGVDELYEWYSGNEVELLGEPTTQPWGMREFEVKDPHGYILRFGQFDTSSSPKVPIERVEMKVRLEKRLAAVMEDVAEHKGMSVSEMLEETLLHTFEPLPDYKGVASPHTKSTMKLIEELKKKHGIDYDTHAGYQFVEE